MNRPIDFFPARGRQRRNVTSQLVTVPERHVQFRWSCSFTSPLSPLLVPCLHYNVVLVIGTALWLDFFSALLVHLTESYITYRMKASCTAIKQRLHVPGNYPLSVPLVRHFFLSPSAWRVSELDRMFCNLQLFFSHYWR